MITHWLALLASVVGAAPRQPTVAEPLALELVRTLSTEIGPRPAGSENEASARQWAIRQLTELGFKNVREDRFETGGWQRGAEHASILLPTPQSLVVAAFGGSVSTSPEGLVANVAYVHASADLAALPEGALRGLIAFVDSPTPAASRLGSAASEAAEDRNDTIAAAARKGAIAVLLRSAATGTARFAHTGIMRYRDGVNKVPAAALALSDADQLARLAAESVPVRVALTLESRDRGRQMSGNILAEIPGTGTQQDIVLLGAHLDSWDLGTGALDDGAGVAMIIAAARRVADHGAPGRTIRIVLFGAEETSLDGARDYARRHAEELAHHIVATEADFGAAPAWGFYSNVPPHLLPMIDRAYEKLALLGIERGHNHASGGEDLYFIRKGGVPVVSLVQDGTKYFDYHHSADDTFEKIDPAALEQNVAALAAFLRVVANP